MTAMVSILLPTIRPDLFRTRLAEYARLDLPWPCEVVVVSDRPELLDQSPRPGLSVRYLVQPRRGNVAATNLAFEAAEGLYVLATNDEVEFSPQMLAALVEAGERYGGANLFSGTQAPYCSNDYYGVFFANCPFGRQTFFRELNRADVLFDPVYACFYADPDLALRAHARGIDVRVVPDAHCEHHCVPDADGHVANWSAYYQRDQATFIARWGHLGPWRGDPSTR